MGRLKCAIDTSAAISLGSTSNFKTAAKFFSFVSTGMINNELIEISKTADKIGNIANNILKSSIIKFIKLEKELQNNRGEVEVINLANKIKADFVLMDDIQARKKLQKQCNVPIRFSPFIIFTLYEKRVLTYKESWSAINGMKREREWKENLIMDYAKLLFGKVANEN